MRPATSPTWSRQDRPIGIARHHDSSLSTNASLRKARIGAATTGTSRASPPRTRRAGRGRPRRATGSRREGSAPLVGAEEAGRGGRRRSGLGLTDDGEHDGRQPGIVHLHGGQMGGGRGDRALFLLLRVEAVVHRVQRVLEREDAEEQGERHGHGPPRAITGGQGREPQRGRQIPGQPGRRGGRGQGRDGRGGLDGLGRSPPEAPMRNVGGRRAGEGQRGPAPAGATSTRAEAAAYATR